MNKKLIAAVSAMAMTVQTFAALTVSAEDDITISAVLYGASAEITLSGTLETDVTVYAASYEGSVLTALSLGSIAAGESAVTLENVSEGAKVYVWDRNQTPVCDPVTVTVKPDESEQTTEPAGEQETEPAAEQTTEPAGEQETEPAAEQTTEPAGEQSTEEPYTAEFTIDGGHASIDVYYTQDYTRADEETVETALARNSATGEIDTSGSGQINFKVCIDDGFEVVSVEAAPAENFNQIKAQGDNIYRVTKVTGDIVITVKTKETEAEADEPISVFDFNTVTSINGVNTSGAAPAEISASEDGTAETVLTLNTVDYITTAGDLSYAAVLAPVTGWGENPYVQVKLSAAGYSDLAVSAAVGATKKGPAEYKLQYSTDGETFTDAGEAYTLAGNKTLYQAFDKVTLEGADDAETLYIRIVPVGTATVGGEVELSGTSGEYAVNNIKIYGAANGNPTAVPAETEEPEATEAAETEEPAGDGIIHLNKTSIDAEGVAGAAVSGTTLTISSGGEYTIEGNLTDGQIITNAADPITLNLAGVNVISSTADALSSSNGIVTIATAAGTENTFTSAAGSAIESSKDLTIKGEGTLNAVSETGNGIRCKADLEIGAGDINVTAYNNGIKGDNSVKITKKATNITVTAETGDAIKSDAISTDKTTGESTIETGKGTVTINGGTLDLTAPGNDGIQADSALTIAGGAIKINSGANGIKANEYNIAEVDDAGAALGNVINGAVEIIGGTLEITSAEEAIRAAEKLDITGGETTLTVTGDAQDAVKAGKNTDTTEGTTTTTTVDVKGIINISDGALTVLKSTDDAIVSMGDVNITGGTVNGGESASDVTGDFFKVYDNFIMIGGTLDIAAYCDGIQSGKALTVTVSGT
ncbi:MAG: carbohydrate-binding domain-containing protein, partial [Candidatus Ornithomonoglobus sp.]